MSKFTDRLRDFTNPSGRVATIDAAKAAPPPSPLAPVDLTDPAQVSGVMDLAARIGDILLSSGTGNNDVQAQIHAITSAYGLHYCHISITLNAITIFTHITDNGVRTPVTVFRVTRKISVNFSKLSEVDRLIRSIQAGATPPEVAEKILDDLNAAPKPRGVKSEVVSWGAMASAISVLLGGDVVVATLSFTMATLIMAVALWLDSKRLPDFFIMIAGGFIATFISAIAYSCAMAHHVALVPSQVIASGIVVLLAGLTLVQSLQDGIAGAPVTSSARFYETLLFTGGIIAGVGLGIETVASLGITLPPLETAATPSLASSFVKVLAGGAVAFSFAIACYAEWSSVFISGLTALVGSFIYYVLLLPMGVGGVTATGIYSTIVGLAGGLLARRFLVPPLITGIAGITPLLPGLAIYRGMYGMLHDQLLIGFSNIALALVTACSLAAGVVLGEWIARKIRRPPKLNYYRKFFHLQRYSFQQAALASSNAKRSAKKKRNKRHDAHRRTKVAAARSEARKAARGNRRSQA